MDKAATLFIHQSPLLKSKIMTIQEKVTNLLKLRSQIDEMKKAIEPLQTQRNELQQNIIEHMKRQGFNSVKTEEATVAKTISKTLRIVDEQKLIDDLKIKGLNDYVIEAVNRNLWKPFERQAIKEGMVLEGTELSETEYISIRKTKGKEEQNDE